MIETIGNCKFCGQSMMVALDLQEGTLEDIVFDEACEKASRSCRCPDGAEWREQKEVIETCHYNIKAAISEGYPDIASFLEEAIPLVYEGQAQSVTCQSPDGSRASISRKGKALRVKLTQKIETELTT